MPERMEAVSTDHVLASIDSALEDWEVSDDAMRWTPEPQRVICDGGRLWPESPAPWKYAPWIYGLDETPVPARWWDVPGTPLGTLLPDGTLHRTCGHHFSSLTFDEAVQFDLFGAEAARAGRTLSFIKGYSVSISGPLTEHGVRWAHALALSSERHNRARCRECNPAGNPPPLASRYKRGTKAARMQGRRG